MCVDGRDRVNQAGSGGPRWGDTVGRASRRAERRPQPPAEDHARAGWMMIQTHQKSWNIMNHKLFKTSLILVGFLVGMSLLCSAVSIYQLLFRECWLWTCAPSRSFKANDLELPVTFYPDNAVVSQAPSPSDDPGIESMILSSNWIESGVSYKSVLRVNQFGTEKKAVAFFNTQEHWQGFGEYSEHPSMTFRSPIADDYSIKCGHSVFGSNYQCELIARYHEFVVYLNADISREMSVNTFEQIAILLDEQMHQLLYSDDHE